MMPVPSGPTTTAQLYADDLRDALGEDLEALVRGVGDLLDQFELAVGVEDARVRAHRVDLDALDGLRRGDQGVRQAAGRQLHDEVVDGDAGTAFHHVDAEYVRPDLAQSRCDRAEGAGTVRELDPDQERQGERLHSSCARPRVLRRCRSVILADASSTHDPLSALRTG